MSQDSRESINVSTVIQSLKLQKVNKYIVSQSVEIKQENLNSK
jgi:hypothetical protein